MIILKICIVKGVIYFYCPEFFMWIIQLDPDHGAPPQQAWRRRLNEHANILKEFSVTFMEALKMVRLGLRLWTYVKEERSQGRKAPIDPFTRERCKPSASQGVPLGGMGYVW